MSNTNSSNRMAVPEAKEAMNKFKMEIANELGVPLTEGYNGNLTSYQNGSIGGYMVKKMIEEAGKADGRQISSKYVSHSPTETIFSVTSENRFNFA